eukprot:CAMPEP_0183510084 /NCGR_PEP_ID=MMETSP0371-20130417/10082_1 /TAXON_ID=268820 /ORGANISM="Peridinium aciculiferum, Strain PAER-2" /LENGTH=120 /DNA_ID=CAMNT_0025706843 /DNA_START=87 /DNA_END=445 /DNA_ORIENTATION=+
MASEDESKSWEFEALPRQATPMASVCSRLSSSLLRRCGWGGAAAAKEAPQTKTAGGNLLAFSFVKQLLGTAAALHQVQSVSFSQSSWVACLTLQASSWATALPKATAAAAIASFETNGIA